ncbi:hypothetical protein BS17DRAFT_773308 [Gyrodon lividus]|nr:hypothetical protein BS17DRAFT_773308 [Gyrodon lividus]
MMCLLSSRLSLSVLTAIAFHVTATSPTGGGFAFGEAPSKISLVELTMRVLLKCKGVVKILYWGLTASEAMHAVVSSPDDCGGSVPITFLLGAILAIAGSLTRFMCYRTLGNLFTFTFSVQPGHKLITHGPYSIVRHPSYTSFAACVLGIVVAQGSHGSWIRESGMLDALWVKFMVLVWLFSMGVTIICLFLRTREEDEKMKEMFGDEWNEWASRVRYRLVPGVY